MVGSTGSGRIAFEQSAATFPGVSAPSRVVRSIIRIARSSANSFDSRLIEALRKRRGALFDGNLVDRAVRGSLGSSGSSKPRGSAGAWATVRV